MALLPGQENKNTHVILTRRRRRCFLQLFKVVRVISPFPVVMCVCVVDQFLFFYFYFSLSLDRLKKKQFVESCDGWSGADKSVAGWTKWKLALAFGSHTVQREKKKKRRKKGVTGWKYSSVGIEAERHRIIIIPSNSGRHSRTADHWTYTQRGRSQKLRVLQTFFLLLLFLILLVNILLIPGSNHSVSVGSNWGQSDSSMRGLRERRKKKCYVIIHRNKNTE
jgi:hypothetical protein